jgi:hypothetical protein
MESQGAVFDLLHCGVLGINSCARPHSTEPLSTGFASLREAPKKKTQPTAESFSLVTLTTTQVETLFGELEYIEPRLKALGIIVADEDVDHV